jgi:hypothetical protein
VPYLAILGFALLLLFYWLRYNCLVILRTRALNDHARQVAQANHLSFPEVQDRLQARPSGQGLRELHQSLLDDYRILTCLLRYTAAFQARGYRYQQCLLAIDFRLMQLFSTLTRRLAPSAARRALRENAQILAHLANWLAERAQRSLAARA